MKLTSLALGSVLLIQSASAVNYLLGFNGGAYGAVDSSINGVDGWSITGATEVSGSPIAYIREYNDPAPNLGASFGGFYAAPDGTSATLSKTFTNTYAGPKVLSFSSSVIDSTSGGGFEDRDTFGFTVRDGGGAAVLTVNLVPTSQSADPDNDTASYTVFYAFGGGALVSSANNISEGGIYNFSLTTGPGGLVFGFGTESQSFTFNGALGAYDVNDTDLTLDFTWDEGAVAGFGDNELLIDNISIVPVPEPSAALLGLGALGFLAARRRR